jgi:hypothetical protein
LTLYRVVLRLILVPLGYLAAVSASTVALVLAAWLPFLQTARAYEDEAFTLFGILVEGGFAFVYAGTATFVPSLIAIAIAETFSIRSYFYYALAGAAVAFAPTLIADPAAPMLYGTQTVLAAGLIGGGAYWLIAGRNAGLADPVQKQPRRA